MNMQQLPMYAVSAFGLEGLVAAELRRLNMHGVQAENGGVRLEGSLGDALLCNLRMRFSDRLYILLAEGPCLSFEELFQLVSSVPWEELTCGTEAFLVTAQCARSRLMSPRDCQAISKKALIERLKAKTRRQVFPESGSTLPVHISVHENRVRVLLDTSGTSLSRRGYRTWNGEAPLRETLAAALVELSPWRPGLPLYDPCCGTGTLLIEAALRQAHMAPGRNRPFAMEGFSFFPASLMTVRKAVLSECEPERVRGIAGSDLDPGALELAERHVRQAELEGRISLRCLPLQELQLEEAGGVFLCNPPYGERLSSRSAARSLARDLSLLQKRHPTWSLCAISSDPGFEQGFGRWADRKRRLYNGRLECQFFTFQPLTRPGAGFRG